MACFKPITAYPSRVVGEKVTFKREYATPDSLLNNKTIPIKCGQCQGCRLERANNWAVRCHHEAQLHTHNSFITLTYNDENIPYMGTLVKSDVQKFMKRLRKYYQPKKIRFYAAGEYGDKLGRPHYHILLFGLGFKDRYPCGEIRGNMYYRSPSLEKIWKKGFSNISDVNLASAGYVARYCMKKITGDIAEKHYERVNQETGEIFKLEPEFNLMSRRPGIGAEWFSKYKNDVFPEWGKVINGVWKPDAVMVDGKRQCTPRYYLEELKKIDPLEYKCIRAARELLGTQYAERHPEENTLERLQVKEKATLQRIDKLKRELS